MASEKPAAAPAAPAGDKEAPAKKGGMKMIIAAVAVVLLEVGTVVVTMKMAGGPKQVVALPPASAPAEKIEKDAEVKVVDAQFPNLQGGRLYMYRFQVALKVAEKDKAKVTELLTEKEFEIKDQIRTIIASADPESLAEPGAETLRRQIGHKLEEDLGKDLVKEVLIPSLSGTPYP